AERVPNADGTVPARGGDQITTVVERKGGYVGLRSGQNIAQRSRTDCPYVYSLILASGSQELTVGAPGKVIQRRRVCQWRQEFCRAQIIDLNIRARPAENGQSAAGRIKMGCSSFDLLIQRNNGRT